jgi:outer membrane receptor for ferrienterochelin and colicin
MLNWILLLSLLLPFNYSYGEEIKIPVILIEDQQKKSSNPIDQFSVFKLEKVAKDKLSDPRRQNLSDILQDQIGVDSQTYCANCGAKRLTINGLKGEHTSILIDGLPLHSAVSSFYGVDNIPSNGIEDVQVMRGAGASLTNPEAIGGTLNLITVDPLSASNKFSSSIGFDDKINGKSQNHSVLFNKKLKNKKAGLILGGQYAKAESWDVDSNNVSEFPERENYSLMAKTRFLLGSKNDFTLRLGKSHLVILGGAADPTRPTQIRPIGGASEFDFEDGNVEKKFTGDPAKITDWVELDRSEAAAKGLHFLTSKINLEWGLGFARQEQKAIYQHGFDYANNDSLVVGDVNLKIAIGQNGMLTLGGFVKDQRLRSASEVLFEQYPDSDPRDIKKDSFNSSSYAAYIQYSHLISEKIELDFALRADHLNINWIELSNQISDTIFAPRFQVLHYLTHDLTQRFSYGLGYRAPLTFFESQHGNFEGGYEIDIDKLEKSQSLVYSLSLNKPNYYVTAGVHYTHLKNMAFGFESFNQPILYRNDEETYDIWASDLLIGYKIKPWWLVEASSEFFSYENGYKRNLPTAAIEERYQLKSKINKGKWGHSLLFNLIGARDLSKYGSYNQHYVDRNQASEPILDPNLELKNQNSPWFFTLDTSVSYQITKSLKLSVAINNIFDFTQTGDGDSPSAWHWHFNHSHFDQLHTWGPNTGRQYFLSLDGTF